MKALQLHEPKMAPTCSPDTNARPTFSRRGDWHGAEGEIAKTGEEDPLALVDDPDMKAVIDAKMSERHAEALHARTGRKGAHGCTRYSGTGGGEGHRN